MELSLNERLEVAMTSPTMRVARVLAGVLLGLLWALAGQAAQDGPAGRRAASIGGPASSPWPMFQRDGRHSGRSELRGPARPDVLWEVELDGVPGTPAVGDDGRIYVPTGRLGVDGKGSLYAVSQVGHVIWQTPLEGLPSSTAPAVADDGSVYVHMNGGGGSLAVEKLVRLDGSGQLQWTYRFGSGWAVPTSAVQASPMIDAHGEVVVASGDGGLYSLAADGEVVWMTWLGTSAITATPALREDGGVVVADRESLYAVSYGGTSLWTVPRAVGEAGRHASASLDVDGGVYVAAGDELRAHGPDGDLRWVYTVPGGAEPTATPALSGHGVVYLPAGDGLHAVDAGTGSRRWHFAEDGGGSASPVVSREGKIYWRTADSLLSVNVDGSLDWRDDLGVTPGAGLDPNPILGATGVLYVPTVDPEDTQRSLLRAYAVNGADFSLTCSPSVMTVETGSSAGTDCAVTPRQGFGGILDLACAEAGADVSCAFDPPELNITGNLPKQSRLTVSVAGSAASGAVRLFAVAAGSTISHSVPLDVQVVGAPQLAFDEDQVWVGEDEGRLHLRVRRDGSLEGSVSVRYGTVDGTAEAGTDYTAKEGTLSFPAGSAEPGIVSVPIRRDGRQEGPESFEVVLSDPSGAAVLGEPSRATVWINDSGGTIGISPASPIVGEGMGSALVMVTRSGAADGEVSVDYAVEGLSAQATADFEQVGGTLRWLDGDTGAKRIPVPILDDAVEERTELVRLELSEAAGGGVLDPEASSVVLLIVDDDGSGECAAVEDALCLLDDRFRVEVEWRDQRSGNHGLGHAALADPANSELGGLFWFFNRNNIELIVKMLDGRDLNDAFWLFYGALSDVEYWVVVTDLETGGVRAYRNHPGSICGVGDTSAFPDLADQEAAAGWSTESAAMGCGEVDGTGPELRSFTSLPAPACSQDAETLCLADRRFQVRVAWRDQRSGRDGEGMAVYGTDTTGYFWFFNEANLELVVKVLDAAGVNGKFWVFYGALSDVEYTITVTDTATGQSRQYVNEGGNICGSADTAAFDAP